MKVETYKLFLDVKQGGLTPEEAQTELLNLLSVTHHKDPKTYTGEEMLKCKLGVYEVFWKSGVSSIAAIGMTFSGQRWLAPTNWTNGSDEIDPTGRINTQLDSIDRITLLYCG
jgi:hypothetical protein